MKTASLALMVVALLFCSLHTQAQEWDEENGSPELYQVEYYKFDPEKADDAKKIIDDYFEMANQIVGIPEPVMELELDSEDYNYMVVWQLIEGEDNLNWQTCPTNNEWYSAFVTVAGSEEKAKEIIERYDSYITASKTEFARR